MITKEGLMGYFPKWTPKRYSDCIRAFGSIDALWDAPRQKIQQSLHWNDELTTAFLQWKKTVDISQIEKILLQENIKVISRSDAAYPALLQQISDPPPCLFVRGTLTTHNPAIAIVGTRAPSKYGIEVTTRLVRELTEQQITIVSGLALGIDAVAHDATVRSGGYTIAVLGSGVDDRSIAPQTNYRLAMDIIESGGVIISEYPPHTQAAPYTFPRRNRIIAGLARGTLVIEAGESSGALITAKCSLDYNRDVFAIPQSIGSKTAVGVNNLLKEGAILVTSAEDIFATLNISPVNKKDVQEDKIMLPPLTDNELPIYSYLHTGPKTIDDMVRDIPLPHSVILTTISLLELKGMVTHVGGSAYAQNKK